MIEASELRIGNWVYDTRTVGESGKAKTKMQVRFIEANSTCNYLEPIQITPEILEKAGFIEKRKNAWYKGRLQWNGHLVYLKNEDTEECYYIPTIVDYVHQLQNLYFSLTGTELIINL